MERYAEKDSYISDWDSRSLHQTPDNQNEGFPEPDPSFLSSPFLSPSRRLDSYLPAIEAEPADEEPSLSLSICFDNALDVSLPCMQPSGAQSHKNSETSEDASTHNQSSIYYFKRCSQPADRLEAKIKKEVASKRKKLIRKRPEDKSKVGTSREYRPCPLARFKVKIMRVKQFWSKCSNFLPNVFKVLANIDSDQTYMEFLDFSNKEVLANEFQAECL